jgi:very-short-patch-repair endonuclease
MRAIGLDGKSYPWNLVGYVPPSNDTRARSELHLRVRNFLKQLFPFERILEEVPLPGSKGLTADFIILQRRLLIEAHGEQHYKFVPYFHGTDKGFADSQKRDDAKCEWACLNHLHYVVLAFNETEEEWRKLVIEI